MHNWTAMFTELPLVPSDEAENTRYMPATNCRPCYSHRVPP